MKTGQKTLIKFDALWRPNESTDQPMLPYLWKAHFIGYPSAYKSLYLVSQIRQFLGFERNQSA